MTKTPEQDIALFLLLSLALVVVWQRKDLQTLWTSLTTPNSTTIPDAFKPFGLLSIGVVVLVFLAGINETFGEISIAVAVGLWLAFLMRGQQTPQHPLVK